VVDGRGRSPRMVLGAGPVPVTVTVTVGRAAPVVVTLQPGAVEPIVVAAPSPALVRIGASSGFTPRALDPASADSRSLGVRVELP